MGDTLHFYLEHLQLHCTGQNSPTQKIVRFSNLRQRDCFCCCSAEIRSRCKLFPTVISGTKKKTLRPASWKGSVGWSFTLKTNRIVQGRWALHLIPAHLVPCYSPAPQHKNQEITHKLRSHCSAAACIKSRL